MPVIQITTWPIEDEARAHSLVENVTHVVHEALGAPLDKISVYVTEVPPSRWGDAGILGSDASFPRTSRRLTYEGEQQ
jgi:4-oxalocrotonate tautomerase